MQNDILISPFNLALLVAYFPSNAESFKKSTDFSLSVKYLNTNGTTLDLESVPN